MNEKKSDQLKDGLQDSLVSRSEVASYIAMLPSICRDAALLKEKYKAFYFGWINPFIILRVSKEDFIFFADGHLHTAFSLDGSDVDLQIGHEDVACVHIRTPVDWYLYGKYICKL